VSRLRNHPMPRILVVDDEEPFRLLVRKHLESSYEVVETGNATEALAMTLENKPDCILMDLYLPEFSGFELCSILCEMNVTRMIPIIMVSGESSPRLEQLVNALHLHGFLQKPVDFDDLKLRISAALATSPRERRREPRVRLAIGTRLVGVDTAGKPFDLELVTHDASASGFSCYCCVEIPIGASVDVWVTSNKEAIKKGRARVMTVQRPGTPEQRYGFCFIDKPEQWVLR
jgi:CheY-like chemotaxis protein